MSPNKFLLAGLCLGLALAPRAYCDVGHDLDNFFDGIGFSSNTTSPGAYESQAAGSYGSGSLVARNQVRQFQLIQLDLPSYKAGCPGIDLYTGSISFLQGDRLKELGKAVMANSAAYAFDVALATTIPELKQIKDNLQDLEQKVNQANINTCVTSQNLVGGLWPKTQASQEKICHDQGTMGKEGMFSDYVTARMGCSGKGKNGDEYEQAMERAKQDPKRKNQVMLGKNLVWSLLKAKSAIGSDKELAELVMSLTGTIIIDKEGHVFDVPSLANNKSLIEALLGRDDGREVSVNIWECKDSGTECMSVRQGKLAISAQKSLKARISKLVTGIYNHIKTDTPLSKEEINLISLSHIQLFKFLTVLASTEYGVNAVDLADYSSLISHDLLTQYLNELLEEAHGVTANSELTEAMIETLEKRVKRAQQSIAKITPEVGHKLDEKLKLIQRIAMIEKQIAVAQQTSME
jgi:conjugative transfer pilus assembly protein TraH